jgi:riboflavin kinase/FMN adenylyltransferase
VGDNWRFGAGGKGDTALLAELGREHRFEVRSVPPLLYYGRPVSSTRVRRAVHDGRLEHAARLLGRPYTIGGVVQHGKGAGVELLACPTANLKPIQLLPPHGVYAANGLLATDPAHRLPGRYPGIAYIGTCPTFTGTAGADAHAVLEFHLFDFDADLYGESMEVELLSFVRPDQAFPTVAQLRAQIAQDLETVRHLVADSVS